MRLSAYGLSSRPIIASLKRAKARGVDVALLLDATNDGRSAPELAEAGVETRLDQRHPVNHEKAIVADGATVLWGSANWTPSSERDHEMCTLATDVILAAKVEADWTRHAAHAEVVR